MNGGASVFFIFLIGVMVVFGAGYMYSASSQGTLTLSTCENEKATLTAQLAASEGQAATSQGQVKQLQAERDAYYALAATLQADRDVQAAVAVTAVADRNAKEAERKAAVDARDQANREAASARATVTVLEQQIAMAGTPAPQVPVTGESGRVIPSSLLPWMGFAAFGVVIFFGAFAFGRSTGKPHHKAQYATDVTTVVMSVEDAREYARFKARR